jgi:hypothetical protein
VTWPTVPLRLSASFVPYAAWPAPGRLARALARALARERGDQAGIRVPVADRSASIPHVPASLRLLVVEERGECAHSRLRHDRVGDAVVVEAADRLGERPRLAPVPLVGSCPERVAER